MSAAEQWAEELDGWRIPDRILAQAPESPWGFPPKLFGGQPAPPGALHRMARRALGPCGTVLDVGCGGGAASVPLVPPAQLAHADLHEQVAFVRRRLCLDSSRDPDIAQALEDAPDRATTTAVVMAWQP